MNDSTEKNVVCDVSGNTVKLNNLTEGNVRDFLKTMRKLPEMSRDIPKYHNKLCPIGNMNKLLFNNFLEKLEQVDKCVKIEDIQYLDFLKLKFERHLFRLFNRTLGEIGMSMTDWGGRCFHIYKKDNRRYVLVDSKTGNHREFDRWTM